MVYMMGDVNIVYINIDFLNETFFMKFYFLEFCLDWLIFLQNDLKRSGLHCDCLCIRHDSFIIIQDNHGDYIV